MQSVPLLKQGAKAVVTGNYFQSWTNIGWLYTVQHQGLIQKKHVMPKLSAMLWIIYIL